MRSVARSSDASSPASSHADRLYQGQQTTKLLFAVYSAMGTSSEQLAVCRANLVAAIVSVKHIGHFATGAAIEHHIVTVIYDRYIAGFGAVEGLRRFKEHYRANKQKAGQYALSPLLLCCCVVLLYVCVHVCACACMRVVECSAV